MRSHTSCVYCSRRHLLVVVGIVATVIVATADPTWAQVAVGQQEGWLRSTFVRDAVPASLDRNYPTGARPPTPEERAFAEKYQIKTAGVYLNRLGLERVREYNATVRPGSGAIEITPAAIGADVSGMRGTAVVTASGVSASGQVMPTAVDNSVLKYFPPIRNQGSLNSCAQFAAVYYTLTHMTAFARDWNAKTGGEQYRFSPKWTYNFQNGGENVGTSVDAGFIIAIKHGAATWAEFPYDDDYRSWCLSPSTWRNALSRRAADYGVVFGVNSDAGLMQVKQLLLNGYVLPFCTYIHSWQYKTIGNDPATPDDDQFSGKYCSVMVQGTEGLHAMTVVGYNDSIWVDYNSNGIVEGGEKGALRIANSWGNGWREGGFVWLAYAALRILNDSSPNSDGAMCGNSVDWISGREYYQPRVIAEFTLNHPKRNQLRLQLGIADAAIGVPANSPTEVWNPWGVFTGTGGPWAFNGSTTACDGTFCLDFTDLYPFAPPSYNDYYISIHDINAGDGITGMVKFAQLLDGAVDHAIVAPDDMVPRGLLDGAWIDLPLRHDFGRFAANSNNDSRIDALDYAAFRTSLGKQDGQAGYSARFDFDWDRHVTYADYWTWYWYYSHRLP